MSRHALGTPPRVVDFGFFRRGASAVGGFGLSVVLLGLVTLVAIPAMIVAEGAAGWGSIAVGQAIGIVASVAIMYGWGVTGPAAVARANFPQLRVEYSESLKVRLLLSVIVLAPAVGASAFFARVSPELGILGCLSTALLGLRGNWVFVGRGEPVRLLVLETLPRILGTLVGVIFMLWLGFGAVTGLLAQITGCIAAIGATSLWVYRHGGRSRSKMETRSTRSLLLIHRHGVVASVTAAAFGSTPIILVGLLAPASLPTFALLQRIMYQMSTASSPLADVLQGWVPRAPLGRVRERAFTAFRLAAVVAGCAAGFFAIIGPFVVDVLGASAVSAPYSAVLATGLATGASLLAYVSGRAGLVPLGMMRQLTSNTLWGTGLGLTATAVLSTLAGAAGAMSGVAIGLGSQVVMNGISMRRTRP